MQREAIILAGGKGTRLQSVVSDKPKPMADINGVPFLSFLLDYLLKYGFKKVILSVGYKYQVILDYYKDKYKNLELIYSIENKPLGTGGAIKQALLHANAENIFVMNGDTFFSIDVNKFYHSHIEQDTSITIALKKMEKFDRYGSVAVEGKQIISFVEKKYTEQGLINGGLYLIKKNLFNTFTMPEKFSFEEDYLRKNLGKIEIGYCVADDYFIDIGIPDDYHRASNELLKFNFNQ